MTIGGPKGFERSYTLEGTAGERPNELDSGFLWMSFLIWPLIGLGGFVLWIILLLKAYQNQMFKLPVIGDLAEKQVGI